MSYSTTKVEVIMQDVLKLIQERQSDRIPFDPERPVAKQDLRQVLEAGRWAPTAHNMQNFEIAVVDDKKLLEAIGNVKRPTSDTFIEENYQQLSFSEEELLRKKVGLWLLCSPRPGELQELNRTKPAIEKRFRDLFSHAPSCLLWFMIPAKGRRPRRGIFWAL